MEITNIKPNIQKKLYDRIRALNREGTEFSPLQPQSSNVNNKSLDAMLTKSCWVRVISAVPGRDENGNATPASLFRLSSAFNKNEGGYSPLNKPLTTQDEFRTSDATALFRPHTGITGISTSFKSKAVQTVQITWTLWDINQFEYYQNAMLKHGRIVMVEFGWSTPEIETQFVDDGTVSGLTDMYRTQRKKIDTYGGDYYTTMGKISNFTFAVGENGQYNCTTDLTAMANDMFSGQIPDGDDKNPIKINTEGLGIEKAMKIANNTFISRIQSLDEDIKSAYEQGAAGVYHNGIEGWCNWAYFEDKILNSYFSFTNDLSSAITQQVETFNSNLLMFIRSRDVIRKVDQNGVEIEALEADNLCRYHSDIATINLDIVLPGTTIKLPSADVIEGKNLSDGIKEKYIDVLSPTITNLENVFPAFKDPDVNFGIIRNFVFRVSFLKGIWGKGISTVESGLNSHWNTVTARYNNFWNFESRSSVADNSQIGVYDKYAAGTPMLDNTNPNIEMTIASNPESENYNGAFEFSVYGKNSLMKNFTVNVNHSSRMATMATFHSNKSRTLDTSMAGPDELSIRAMSKLNNTQFKKDQPGTTGEDENSTDEVLKELYTPFMRQYYVDRETPNDQNSNYVLKNIDDDALGFMADPSKAKETQDEVLKEIELQNKSEKAMKEAEGKNYWYKDEDNNVDEERIIYDVNGNMLDIYSKTLLGKINNTLIDPQTNKATVHPIVPITLSFTIPGIAGLEIFDIFTVDYLPKAYRDRCMFQVMSISHTVSLTGWETGVEAIMRIDLDALSSDDERLGGEVKTTMPEDNETWLQQANKSDKANKPPK